MTSFLNVSFIPSEQCVLFFPPQSSLLTVICLQLSVSYRSFFSPSQRVPSSSILLRSALDPLGLSSQAKSLHQCMVVPNPASW